MKTKTFSAAEQDQLAKLAALPDEDIDTADIPPAPDANWANARRGDLYRPLKKPVTIRLDVDVVTWFKDHATGNGYQTEINRVLRQHVAKTDREGA
jgi:uncharacterized protein (DUF4415 family)